MKRSILIRGARQLLTLHGPTGSRRGEALRNLGLIEDGSVLIVNGTITSVGPTRRIENLAEARSAEEINASGHVVMPGFVDSHTQLVSPPPRVLQFRVNAGETPGHGPVSSPHLFWTALQYIRNTPASTLEFQARKHLEACLRHGTTTLEIKTGYGLNATGETKMLRVLAALNGKGATVVPTFFGARASPPEYAGQPVAYLSWLADEMLPKLRARHLAHFVDVLCDDGGFTADQARPYLLAAKRFGLAIKVYGEQALRTGAVRLALEFDAVSVDGLNAANSDEVELLARAQTIATLMPVSAHFGYYSDMPPARELIDRGAAVALATGFHPSLNSTFNMQTAISLACSSMNMAPEEAIAAATINGAHAIARASRCGSLEAGKDADVLILNVSDYREIPLQFGCNSVAIAMRKGEVVYREGEVNCDAS